MMSHVSVSLHQRWWIKKSSQQDVGSSICGIKKLADAKVGDTVTHKSEPATEALPGFADIKPMVYSGIYPIESKQFES